MGKENLTDLGHLGGSEGGDNRGNWKEIGRRKKGSEDQEGIRIKEEY